MSTPATQHLMTEIDRYFNTVTDDQFKADLARAEFDFYNKIGRKVFITHTLGAFAIPAPPHSQVNHSVPVKSDLAGTFEEMALAA